MILFQTEDIKFHVEHKRKLKEWIKLVAASHSKKINDILYIFCSDDYLHKINVEQLDHDTLTDIITFPYHDEGEPLEAELFISIDRVKDNAKDLNQDFDYELRRVMIHGVLHLCGFNDETDEEESEMRRQEDIALAMFHVER
jgi:rRNA maturation RNase YbeY